MTKMGDSRLTSVGFDGRTCENRGAQLKTGRAGVDAPELPALTPDTPEALMKVDHASTPWTTEVRDAARESVTIAADQHRAIVRGADRTLAYYLRTAAAHGLTVSEIVDAGDLDAKTVLRLLDPAVCD